MNTNEKKRTLAQELKIQNLERQRDFIFKKLESYKNKPTEGGDIFFVYKGFIFPEVKKALAEEGFVAEPLKPATAIGYFGSPQVNIIRISDDVMLDDDEIEESKEYTKIPTKGLDSNGHKNHYSLDKPRYKSFAEYEASRAQQSDEYGESLNDGSVDSDYMPKLVADIKSMRQSDNQPSNNQTVDIPIQSSPIETIYGCGQDLDKVFTAGPSSNTGSTALPSSSNSIPAVPPDAYIREKRIEKAQKRQKRGRNGKH